MNPNEGDHPTYDPASLGFFSLPTLYRLDGKKAVQCESIDEWVEWVRTNPNRTVARTEFAPERFLVTSFLISDHGWRPGKKHLFETMLFTPDRCYTLGRMETWEEAEANHAETLAEMVDGKHPRENEA